MSADKFMRLDRLEVYVGCDWTTQTSRKVTEMAARFGHELTASPRPRLLFAGKAESKGAGGPVAEVRIELKHDNRGHWAFGRLRLVAPDQARVGRRGFAEGVTAEYVQSTFRAVFLDERVITYHAEGMLFENVAGPLRRVRPLLIGGALLVPTAVEFQDVQPDRSAGGLSSVHLRTRSDGTISFALGYDDATGWPRERLWQREQDRVGALLRDVLGAA